MSKLKIYVSCFNTAVCLWPKFISGIAVVGFGMSWVISATACVSESADGILSMGVFSGKNYVVPKTLSTIVLGTNEVRQR